MAKRKTVALLRISTGDQDLDVQRGQVEAWARAHGIVVEQWIEETISGAAARRPQLEQLLDDARRGRVGTVVVVALDRLGRSALNVIQNIHALDEAGTRVVSLRECLDFSTPAGRLVASVLAHVAEIERETLRERTRAGIAAARRRGRHPGRPRLVFRDAEVADLRAALAAGHSLRHIAREGLVVAFDTNGNPRKPSAATLAKALREADSGNGLKIAR